MQPSTGLGQGAHPEDRDAVGFTSSVEETWWIHIWSHVQPPYKPKRWGYLWYPTQTRATLIYICLLINYQLLSNSAWSNLQHLQIKDSRNVCHGKGIKMGTRYKTISHFTYRVWVCIKESGSQDLPNYMNMFQSFKSDLNSDSLIFWSFAGYESVIRLEEIAKRSLHLKGKKKRNK